MPPLVKVPMAKHSFSNIFSRETGGCVLFRVACETIASSVILGLILWGISWSFGLVGGIREFSSAIRFEMPYLLITYAALLHLMRPTRWRVVIAALPIIVLYLAIDLHYVLMHSVFKLDELLLLPEGLNVSPAWLRVGTYFVSVIWIVFFIKNFRRRPRELTIPVLLLVLALVPPVTAYTLPQQFLKAADASGFSILPWSDRFTSAVIGRTTALFLFAATKNKALEDLSRQSVINDPDRNPALLKDGLHKARNIHIVILESFLDPQLFTALEYRTPPAPPRFEVLKKNMHISRSPVFGGGTAQVEFEILCGVPALELYSPAEFNMFKGQPTPCLPNLLDAAGYKTVATQSYKPDFFNSEQAYQSMGFKQTNFPSFYAENRQTYLKYNVANSYIFDGDLLSQNLLYVEQLLKEGKPIFNYVLGTYGHLPHLTDIERFPPKVEVIGVKPGSQAYLAIQQFYYRAGAVADYVQRLRKMDPESLIIVTADHLPPLDAGPLTYETLGYSLRDGGKFKQNIWFYYGPKKKNIAWPDRDYEFMDFILDVLTEERICKKMVCKNREGWPSEKLTTSYNRIISLGAGISTNSSQR